MFLVKFYVLAWFIVIWRCASADTSNTTTTDEKAEEAKSLAAFVESWHRIKLLPVKLCRAIKIQHVYYPPIDNSYRPQQQQAYNYIPFYPTNYRRSRRARGIASMQFFDDKSCVDITVFPSECVNVKAKMLGNSQNTFDYMTFSYPAKRCSIYTKENCTLEGMYNDNRFFGPPDFNKFQIYRVPSEGDSDEDNYDKFTSLRCFD